MPDEETANSSSRYDRTPAYAFDVEDQPTNILVENGQIRLASMCFIRGDSPSTRTHQ
jgi:hypothetical protein